MKQKDTHPAKSLMLIHYEMNPQDVVIGQRWHQLISLQAHNVISLVEAGQPWAWNN